MFDLFWIGWVDLWSLWLLNVSYKSSKHVDEVFLSNLDPIPTKDISSTVVVATSIVEHPWNMANDVPSNIFDILSKQRIFFPKASFSEYTTMLNFQVVFFLDSETATFWGGDLLAAFSAF